MGRWLIPPDGSDEQMKQPVHVLFGERSLSLELQSTRKNVQRWLEATAPQSSCITASTWRVGRTPRDFLERRSSGAQFSTLPAALKTKILEELSVWAAKSFGSLDSVFTETHEFGLRAFKFEGAGG